MMREIVGSKGHQSKQWCFEGYVLYEMKWKRHWICQWTYNCNKIGEEKLYTISKVIEYE